MAVPRFTFGSDFLQSGFQFLPVLIGVFAFAQIMSDLERIAAGTRPDSVDAPDLKVSHLAVIWEILSRPFLLLWSTIIGLLIGVLPAIGGSAANVMAYDQAKKFSKHPEKFGTGIPEGIIASEASNNSNVAGSLVTIMAFGIPGDAVTAVMLGAMTIHGIQPGPLFMSQQPHVAYGIFAAYILAHPVMIVLQWLLAGVYLRIVRVPKAVLIPQILVLCVIGAYALNNVMANVYALLLFGSGGLPAREVRVPAGAAHPGGDPRRPDRGQPGARAHDRRRSAPLPHPADLGRHAAPVGRLGRARALAAPPAAPRRSGGRRRARYRFLIVSGP